MSVPTSLPLFPPNDDARTDAFSPNLIEIRDAFTGRLAQVILGSQILLTYDGTSIDHDIDSPVRTEEEEGSRCCHVSKRVGSFHVLFSLVPVSAV